MIKVRDIQGNTQRLDGGAMFGNAPRAMWSRWCPPDDLGRIELACRALLVESDEQRVLLETGIGSFFPPNLKERYGVVEDRHILLESLAKHGVTPESIDAVVLSHLHFDHAGGLLTAWREGRPPTLVFERARFIVGRRAWERATHPHPRDRVSFIPELIRLLEDSGRLEIIDDPTQTGELLGPAFSFDESDGHTPGMLHAKVSGKAASMYFCADLIPGTPWVHVPITMGYDRFPEALIDEKAERLASFEGEGTWLFFTHDPRVAAARVDRDEKGRFCAVSPVGSLGAGWDLDQPCPPA